MVFLHHLANLDEKILKSSWKANFSLSGENNRIRCLPYSEEVFAKDQEGRNSWKHFTFYVLMATLESWVKIKKHLKKKTASLHISNDYVYQKDWLLWVILRGQLFNWLYLFKNSYLKWLSVLEYIFLMTPKRCKDAS